MAALSTLELLVKSGAGEGIRTPDPNLGRLQLRSYALTLVNRRSPGEATGVGVSGLLTSAAWFAEHARGGMAPDPRHAVRRMARICSLATWR
jgi:hypothetical protein